MNEHHRLTNVTAASPSLDVIPYDFCVLFSLCDQNAMILSLPCESSCINTPPIWCFEQSLSITKGLVKSVNANTGAVAKAALISFSDLS